MLPRLFQDLGSEEARIAESMGVRTSETRFSHKS
jgi:hypothetical protein